MTPRALVPNVAALTLVQGHGGRRRDIDSVRQVLGEGDAHQPLDRLGIETR